MKDLTIFDIRDDLDYRKIVLESICTGVRNSSELKNYINYVLDNKLSLFESDVFSGSFYEDDDDFLDLLIPTIKRLYAKFFITPPQILTPDQLELFTLHFDLDVFLNYIVEMIPKVKKSLEHFSELDRTSETMTLIVDNYVAGVIRKCIESNSISRDIRDIKIKRTIEK